MSDIYSMPGHLIRRLHQISTSVFADQMKAAESDMTPPQFAALRMLREHPGIDQATLAGLIALDRPTMGGIIDRLSAKGWIERRVNPGDRRARVLTLTPDGAALLAKLEPTVALLQDDILSGLSDNERAEFISLIRKIVDARNGLSQVPAVPPEQPD